MKPHELKKQGENKSEKKGGKQSAIKTKSRKEKRQ
jgi:hypothetical protein